MKKDHKRQTTSLRLARETLRELTLGAPELKQVVGGTNACGSGGGHLGQTSICLACQN